MFKKILIANRGEIACRIIRSCKQLGVKTVAVYSSADREALHVRSADESVLIGDPAPTASYLSFEAIIGAVKSTRAEAVHPGYGFLSENSKFVEALRKEKITFIGPDPESLALLGDKIQAQGLADKLKVPRVPSALLPEGKTKMLSAANDFIKEHKLPLMVKAVAGGGGKGMRVVDDIKKLEDALVSASREATSYFGNGNIYLEKLVFPGRHVEVQGIADSHGNVATLGTRDCSFQRNHQKIIEEAPAPNLPKNLSETLEKDSKRLLESAKYKSLGTIEFLVDGSGKHYFLEVNGRLQVEHPVTEAIYGQDLVDAQIRIAAGEHLKDILPKNLSAKGHSIECRICAEREDFTPSTGTFSKFKMPEESKNLIRLDTGFERGDRVSHHYDSLVAKAISFDNTREGATKKALEALTKIELFGVQTNCSSLIKLLDSKEFSEVSHHVTSAPELLKEATEARRAEICIAAALSLLLRKDEDPWSLSNEWRILKRDSIHGYFTFGDIQIKIQLFKEANKATISANFEDHEIAKILENIQIGPSELSCTLSNETIKLRYNVVGKQLRISGSFGPIDLKQGLAKAIPQKISGGVFSGEILSPLPGKILSILVSTGERISCDQPLILLESMKMEHKVPCPGEGTIEEVLVKEGQIVEAGSPLLRVGAA